MGATLTVSIAALLTVILRLYVRLAIIRNFGWDVCYILETNINTGDIILNNHYRTGL